MATAGRRGSSAQLWPAPGPVAEPVAIEEPVAEPAAEPVAQQVAHAVQEPIARADWAVVPKASAGPWAWDEASRLRMELARAKADLAQAEDQVDELRHQSRHDLEDMLQQLKASEEQLHRLHARQVQQMQTQGESPVLLGFERFGELVSLLHPERLKQDAQKGSSSWSPSDPVGDLNKPVPKYVQESLNWAARVVSRARTMYFQQHRQLQHLGLRLLQAAVARLRARQLGQAYRRLEAARLHGRQKKCTAIEESAVLRLRALLREEWQEKLLLRCLGQWRLLAGTQLRRRAARAAKGRVCRFSRLLNVSGISSQLSSPTRIEGVTPEQESWNSWHSWLAHSPRQEVLRAFEISRSCVTPLKLLAGSSSDGDLHSGLNRRFARAARGLVLGQLHVVFLRWRQERRKLGALHCFSVHRVAKLAWDLHCTLSQFPMPKGWVSLEAAQRMAELEGQLVARGRAREESLHGFDCMVTHTQRAWSTHLLRPAFRGWAEARASAWEAARRRSLELLARDAKEELLRCLLLWRWVQERSHARRRLSARLSGAFERRSWRQTQVLCQLLAAWRRRLCHRGWVSVLGRARPLNQAWFWAWRLASRRASHAVRRQAGGLLAFQRHSLRGAWLTWRWRIQLARSVRHLARGLPREASAASFLLAWRMDARSTARLRHWQSTSRYLAEGREECRRRGVLLACIAAWRLRLAQHLRQVELQRANASRVLSAWHAAAQSRRLARERTAEREILVAQLGRLSAHRRGRWARRALSCWRSAAQRFRAAAARHRSRLLRCAFHALRGVHALGLWARERETARKQYLSRLSSARFQHAAAIFHAWHLRSLRRRLLRLPHGFQRQGLTTAVLTCWRSHTRLRHSAARRPFPRDFAALVLRLWRRTAGRLARRLEASAPRQAPLLELMVRWAAEARDPGRARLKRFFPRPEIGAGSAIFPPPPWPLLGSGRVEFQGFVAGAFGSAPGPPRGVLRA
ncbi:unnamed protein product [Effrenium voratum]|nr:unnamed protein product [Effrenium voratum]